jgi:hypothetical protein
MLPLAAYRAAIALDEPFRPSAAPADRPAEQVRSALGLLAADPAAVRLGPRDPGDVDATTARRALRVLLTIRAPGPLPGGAAEAVLGAERALRPTMPARQLPTVAPESPVSLWRGDITALVVDAIVNAAGPRLRDDCATVMTSQGSPEPTGTAKITRGCHLPAR